MRHIETQQRQIDREAVVMGMEKMKRQRTQIRDEVNKILDREVVDVDINRHTSQENRAYCRGQNRSINQTHGQHR